MTNQTDVRSSEEIRRDLEGARSGLHHTVDALERRLSPGQFVDELWGRVRGSADEGAVSAFGHVVRRHPAPAALIGLGLAWMVVEKTGVGGEGAATASSRRGAEGNEASGVDRVKSGAGSALDAAKGKAHEMADKVKAKASDAADTVKSGVTEARGRAAEWSDNLDERARGAGHERWGVRSSVDKQPLAAGALTFGLGLAVGLMAPATTREDRLMGSAADTVKDETRRATKDVAESAKGVAEDVAEAVKEEIREQDVTGRLGEAAEKVGSAAKEEVRERAEVEEIDADGMRRRAARAGEEIRDRVRGTE